jgi:CSLREA domain-containing protein
MRQPPIKSTLVAILASIAIVFIVTRPRHVQAAGFVVNSLADNTTSGDGLCTLREAIQSATTPATAIAARIAAATTRLLQRPGTFRLSSTLPNIVSGQGTLTINGARDGDHQWRHGQQRHRRRKSAVGRLGRKPHYYAGGT